MGTSLAFSKLRVWFDLNEPARKASELRKASSIELAKIPMALVNMRCLNSTVWRLSLSSLFVRTLPCCHALLYIRKLRTVGACVILPIASPFQDAHGMLFAMQSRLMYTSATHFHTLLRAAPVLCISWRQFC